MVVHLTQYRHGVQLILGDLRIWWSKNT